MTTYKACRVTFEGFRYQINADGRVFGIPEQLRNEPAPKGAAFTALVDDPRVAQLVRAEASRQRRNRNARARHEAMTSLGMTRTPYGYE